MVDNIILVVSILGMGVFLAVLAWVTIEEAMHDRRRAQREDIAETKVPQAKARLDH